MGKKKAKKKSGRSTKMGLVTKTKTKTKKKAEVRPAAQAPDDKKAADILTLRREVVGLQIENGKVNKTNKVLIDEVAFLKQTIRSFNTKIAAEASK